MSETVFKMTIYQDGTVKTSDGETYTDAETIAYALLHTGSPLVAPTPMNDIRKAGDEIIALAQRIKDERAALGIRE